MLVVSYPCEFGTVGTHQTTEPDIPGDRILFRVIFSSGKLRSFTLAGTLHWVGNQRLITGVGSNPKFLYWRPDVIILELQLY